MKKILQDLWRGNICEMEHSGNGFDLQRAEQRANDLREQLAMDLTDKQKKLLEAYTDEMYSVSSELAEDAFVRGVSLGMRLALEAML